MPTTTQGLVEKIFHLHHKELSGYLRKRLYNQSTDASDVAQETYLRMLRIKNINDIENPRAYLYKVASHVIRELGLRERKQSDICDQVTTEPRTEIAPEALVSSQEQMQKLEQLIDQLPPMYKAVLLLRKQQGMTHQEIAESLDISPHTVKKYLFRALAYCRENAESIKGEAR